MSTTEGEYKPGRKKTGGRKRGTPNRTTVQAKKAIELAAEGIGGTDRLIAWVKENPDHEKVFWSQMYTKLLPLQHEGSGVTVHVHSGVKGNNAS